jgi:hypothetical protein
MEALGQHMNEYRKQLEKGNIQKAYKGLMDYILGLKAHFERRYPNYAPGNLYFGYMDMTYFSLFPETLKHRKLKIAVVFLHEQFRFEVWLSAFNKQVQKEYWDLFRETGWSRYRIPPTLKGIDSIVEYTLAEKPDFADLEALTKQIEKGTLRFIEDIECFLSKH